MADHRFFYWYCLIHIQHALDCQVISVEKRLGTRYVKDRICLYRFQVASRCITTGGICGASFLMISVFFSETVRSNASHTWTITSIVFASARGERDTTHSSPAYNIPRTARRTQSIGASSLVSRRCSCKMSASSINLWRTSSRRSDEKVKQEKREYTSLS